VIKRLSRIAPWQAGKLFAVVYFFLSLLFVIPMFLALSVAPLPASSKFSPGILIIFPFLYALAALIFVPLGCWIYNMAARLVGGLQVSVTDDAEA
jgi:hypothetical protein